MNYNVDQEFKNEVKAGLDKDIKKISSKFLYDNEGSNLFVKIFIHLKFIVKKAIL